MNEFDLRLLHDSVEMLRTYLTGLDAHLFRVESLLRGYKVSQVKPGAGSLENSIPNDKKNRE